MRNWKNFLTKIFPHQYHFVPTIEEKNPDKFTIEERAVLFSTEVKKWLKWRPQVNKISFIGHSLGGVIIRAALSHLSQFKNLMHSYMSLSSPHLGAGSHSLVIKAGLEIFKKLINSKLLREMDFSDAEFLRNKTLFKLSTAEGLE